MAGTQAAPLPEGEGSKKSVDFQLNLVPFIDLLSVLISFLLMTSVWTQVSKIDVQNAPNQPSLEPQEVDPAPKLDLTVLVSRDGYTVSVQGGVVKTIEKRGEDYDKETLSHALGELRAAHPENEDIVVSVDDQVSYQDLIEVMDTALAEKLTKISVQGTEG